MAVTDNVEFVLTLADGVDDTDGVVEEKIDVVVLGLGYGADDTDEVEETEIDVVLLVLGDGIGLGSAVSQCKSP